MRIITDVSRLSKASLLESSSRTFVELAVAGVILAALVAAWWVIAGGAGNERASSVNGAADPRGLGRAADVSPARTVF